MLNPATPHRVLLRSVLGDVLRRIRRQQERTLADVALQARVSMPYLSEVERGRKEVSSEVLAALCAALGIELSDLLVAVAFEISREHVIPVRRTTARFEVAAPPARRAGDAYALAA